MPQIWSTRKVLHPSDCLHTCHRAGMPKVYNTAQHDTGAGLKKRIFDAVPHMRRAR